MSIKEPLGLFYINLAVPIFLLTGYNAGMQESENHRKLNSRFATIPYSVTPNKIQNYLNGPKELFDVEMAIEKLFENLPDEVMAILETSNGKLKRNKVANFKESLTLLSDEFDINDFMMIDGSCLDKSGAIDKEKFRMILSKKKPVKSEDNTG